MTRKRLLGVYRNYSLPPVCPKGFLKIICCRSWRKRWRKPNCRETIALETSCLFYFAGSSERLRTAFRQASRCAPPRGGEGRGKPQTLQEAVTVTIIIIYYYCCYSLKSFLECVVSLFEALAFPMPLEPQASRGGGLIFLKGCRVGARGFKIFHLPPGHTEERVI